MTVHEAATDYAVPTGDFIAEWLEDHSMRASELATRMGVSRKHVSKLLAGASLTPEVATKLELVTAVPARRWLALEALYRTDLARLALEARLEEHAALLEDVPLADLRKRGFVTVTRAKPGQALRECMAFFRVGDVSALSDLLRPPAIAFRQSAAHPVKWGSVATWLRLGEPPPRNRIRSLHTTRLPCESWSWSCVGSRSRRRSSSVPKWFVAWEGRVFGWCMCRRLLVLARMGLRAGSAASRLFSCPCAEPMMDTSGSLCFMSWATSCIIRTTKSLCARSTTETCS